MKMKYYAAAFIFTILHVVCHLCRIFCAGESTLNILFSVVQMNFVPRKHVSGRIFNCIGLFIRRVTQLLASSTCEIVVNITKLYIYFNLVLLARLCIVTLIFLFIDLTALLVAILTLATHSNMINIITSSCANKLFTSTATQNNIDSVRKTSATNPLLNAPSDSASCLTMIANNTIKDCVTARTAAKESNLIRNLLFHPHKAKAAIITYDPTAETSHKAQTGANLSNSCLTAREREKATNDLMVNTSKTIETIDSKDTRYDLEYTEGAGISIEYSDKILSQCHVHQHIQQIHDPLQQIHSDDEIFHSACDRDKQLCSIVIDSDDANSGSDILIVIVVFLYVGVKKKERRMPKKWFDPQKKEHF